MTDTGTGAEQDREPVERNGEDAADSDSDAESGEDQPDRGVVLDYLARGRPEDDRPQYEKQPVAHVLGLSDFRLLELEFASDDGVSIGDTLDVDPPDERIASIRDIDYDDLSSGATSELEYAVEDIVEGDEERFVDFYNDAGPITLRLHQLNLLPGIGKKLRNNILDQRKREPFESFEQLEERVSGFHRPEEVLVERIMEELREEDLKYRIFVRRETDG